MTAAVVGKAIYETELRKDGLERGLQASGATLSKFGIVAGVAFGAAGIAALRMGDDYDEAMDSIRLGTGATGKDLAGLEQSFKNVGGRVKEDIGLTAQVMADLNTRTGLTGKALEDMTVRVLEFSRVTGTDATENTARLTRIFGDWNIATEDQEGAMDKLLRTSQSTGLGVDQLGEKVVQFGAPMRLLGFSFEESIALLGKWEKEGVNTETMLQGLKFSVKTLAQEGVPASEMAATLQEKIAAIGKSADPVAESIKLFGLRAGPDLAAAILEGRFSIDDLMEAIENGSETVAGAALDTRDFGDGIAELKNKVKLAIGPITKDFAGLAGELGNAIYLLPALGGAMGKLLGPTVSKVIGGLATSGPVMAASGLVGAAIAKAKLLGMRLYLAGAAVVSAIASTIMGWIGPALTGAAGAVGGALGAAKVAGMKLYMAGAAAISMLASALMGMVPGLTPAAEGAGKMLGGKMGMALKVGVLLGVAAIGSELGPKAGQIGADLNKSIFGDPAEHEKQGGMLGGTIVDSITDGLHEGWRNVGDFIIFGPGGFFYSKTEYEAEQAGLDLGQVFLGGVRRGLIPRDPPTPDVLFGPPTPEWYLAGEQRGEALTEGVVEGVRRRPELIINEIERQAGMLRGQAWLAAARELGEGIPGAIGKGMMDESRQVLTSLDVLRDILKNGLTPKQQGLEVIGAEYIKLVRQGMTSEIPGAQRTAQEVAIAAINTFEDSGLDGSTKKGRQGLKAIGEYYDMLLASGMTASQARVALAAGGVTNATIDALEGKKPAFEKTGRDLANATGSGLTGQPWAQWGLNAASAWVRSFTTKIGSTDSSRSLQTQLARFAGPLRAFSPPREGPLRDLDKWGGSAAESWAGSFAEVFRRMTLPLGGLAAQLQPAFSMPTPAMSPAFARPGYNVGPVGSMPSSAPQGVRDVTININGGDLAEVRRVVGEVLDGAESIAGHHYSTEPSF